MPFKATKRAHHAFCRLPPAAASVFATVAKALMAGPRNKPNPDQTLACRTKLVALVREGHYLWL
jgi:hypothetical protein